MLPFRGVKSGAADQIVNSETVMRVLGPPFFVMVDNCDPALANKLQNLPIASLEQGMATKDIDGQEVRFLARLLIAAARADRQIEVVPIPQKDILGALDDACIAAVLRRREGGRPPWPGFEELVEQHGSAYDKALEKYGVSKDAAIFEEFALEMCSRGLVAPDIERVLDCIEFQVRAL